MVEAKVAAARLTRAAVVFVPEDSASVVSHAGDLRRDHTMADRLDTPGFEAAGRDAAGEPDDTTVVGVDDVRQALAWLCGRTGLAATCAIARAAAATTVSAARPYGPVRSDEAYLSGMRRSFS
jgi:hypothetical protein